ncbi:MAG: hypothetical protein IT454_21810 [Planctomycetes bacterium]|nr:hypothetical protein [Planctomycetota bacterium]
MAEPARAEPGPLRSIAALLAIALALVYLSNVGQGTFELVPDAAPLFGNLDEVVASLVLFWGSLTLFGRRRS